MASAQRRSETRGRPLLKRWALPWTGNSGCKIAHNASEIRNPAVVRLFGARRRSRFLVGCASIFLRKQLKTRSVRSCQFPLETSYAASTLLAPRNAASRRCAHPRSASSSALFLIRHPLGNRITDLGRENETYHGDGYSSSPA